MNFTRIVSRISFFLLFTSILFFSTRAQVRLAGEVGLHSANFLETNSIPNYQSSTGKYFSSKTGFQLGVLAEIPLGPKNLFLQPGINYSAKGNQYERFFDTTQVKSDTLYDQHTLNLNYVEIPFLLTYKLTLSAKKRNYFVLSAGPYFAFIFNASQSYQNRIKPYGDSKYNFNSGSEDLDVGTAQGKYKTLDAGFKLKGGFELGNVMLSAYYSRGLSNAYQAAYPSSFHHQVAGVSLGIWLSKSKAPVGPEPDTDHDGTPDKDDSCKTIAGIPKYHGCPIPDSDQDGVNDEMDSCKLSPGLVRYHGCPIPDTDQDGINDEEDSCKTIAGVTRYHGCPIPDTDHDGVNDEEDQCPAQAGPVGNRGCPVIAPEPPKRKIFEAPSVQFKSSSSQLTPGSAPALQALADTLKTNPGLELAIEGHTDNSGRPEANMKLSLQRALAVKKALLALGVEESRISVKGLGDTQPAGDNRTEEGKRQNRRVVFELRQKNS